MINPLLEGKRVLVTGAARGIGASIAEVCASTGDDLSMLFVTTASMVLTAAELQAQLYAGSLFVLDVGTSGTPIGSFAGG